MYDPQRYENRVGMGRRIRALIHWKELLGRAAIG